MFKNFSLVFSFILLLTGVAHAEEDADVAKIKTAKEQFFADRDKADNVLLELLTKKETTAQQTGDLKTLEASRAQIADFRQSGKLPTLVPTRDYDNALKLARTKVETAYKNAIRNYTKANNLELAKETQKQLDDFLAESSSTKTADPFAVNTRWVTEDGKRWVEITQRKGNTFEGIHANHFSQNINLKVSGTINGDKLEWLAKDTVELGGGKPSSFNATGTLKHTDKGDVLDIHKWSTTSKHKETHSYYLEKAKK